MIDPLVSLAHSVFTNKGVYALLVGSGLSTSAGIPTGWNITIDLIRRIAAAEGADPGPDPEAWFRANKGKEPNYSELLDALARTREERRAILHGYIEPTPSDIEGGRRVPTSAHRAIARLVARGYIRVIITPNFDRLIETALRAEGVEPTVISSADDAKGAMPLIHCPCVIVKIHGDYLDTRIRNTEAELSAYDPEIDLYLDRILDEFGLIVAGWSGEWDAALRAAILRAPNRRFTTWWTARGGAVGSRAQALISARHAQMITVSSADEFFTAVESKIAALEDVSRPHPLSAKLAVAELNRHLRDPLPHIRVHDLVTDEAQAVARRLRGPEFSADSQWSPDELRRRLDAYEAMTEILRAIVVAGVRWAPPEDDTLWCDVVRRLLPPHPQPGVAAYIDIQMYAPMLAFYATGLSAAAAERYALLKRLLEMPLPRRDAVAVDRLLPFTAFEHLERDHFQFTPGQRKKTPLNDRLHNLFKAEMATDLPDAEAFDDLFDRFETIVALTYMHRRYPQVPAANEVWVPPGRFCWRLYPRHGEKEQAAGWFAAAEAQKDAWPPIASGLFGGSWARFKSLEAVFRQVAARLGS